jgi:hypothetical protein
MKRLLILALLLISSLAFAGEAAVVYPWGKDKVWPAAVRFLRIDRKLKVTEKDEAAGYVMFELQQDGKTFTGTLELARVDGEDGGEATRAELKIDRRPSYVADTLLEKLGDKLKKELGTTPAREKPAEEKPAE